MFSTSLFVAFRLVILKARFRDDFRAAEPATMLTIDGQEYPAVSVEFDGPFTDLLIAEDGTIAAIEFRGRTPQGYQTIQRRFFDYKTLDNGLKLPIRQTDQIEGQTEVYREVTFDTVTVNDTIDDSLFGGKQSARRWQKTFLVLNSNRAASTR